jgi:hypothetical protein
VSRRLRSGLAVVAALAALAMFHPRPGGTLALYYPGDPWDPMPAGLQTPADRILCGAVFETLVRAGPGGTLMAGAALDWETADGGETWSVRLDPLARFPDGRRVSPADVIRAWEEVLLAPGTRHRFLLEPVLGVPAFLEGSANRIEGLEAEGDLLRIRGSRRLPDLPWRLAHPALAVGSVDRFGAPTGPGPFLPERRGDGLAGNPLHAGGAPFVERFFLRNDPGIDADLLVEAGEVQAAILLGRPAGSLRRRAPEGVRVERAPGWDRTYALLINPRRVPDAAARALLARAVDRDGMVRLLFDRQGEAAGSLLDPSAPVPPPADPADRGHGAKLVLRFDRTDPMAGSIAARLKASWEQRRFALDLDGSDPPDLREAIEDGAHGVALVLHQPAVADPVLALQDSLDDVGAGLEDAQRQLRDAAALEDPAARLAAALAAEAGAIADHRLVPLVRLQAWLARDARLVGIDPSAPGTIRLGDAFYLP